MCDHERDASRPADESGTTEPDATPAKLSRRDFLKVTGGGALGSALVAGHAFASPQPPQTTAEVIKGTTRIALKVNGTRHSLEVRPQTTLLSALRHQLGLTGAKEVCDRGQCGACTVLLNGKPVLACMTLALNAVGSEIMTVEGLAPAGKLDPVQQAFVEQDGLMCGYCTPGFVMSVRALLNRNPNPTEAEVRQAVSGNLCRCGTYPRVFAAALAAAKSGSGRRS